MRTFCGSLLWTLKTPDHTPNYGRCLITTPWLTVQLPIKNGHDSPHLQDLRGHVKNDEEYKKLCDTILRGFPDHYSQLPEPLSRYWRVREHLTVDDNGNVSKLQYFSIYISKFSWGACPQTPLVPACFACWEVCFTHLYPRD